MLREGTELGPSRRTKSHQLDYATHSSVGGPGQKGQIGTGQAPQGRVQDDVLEHGEWLEDEVLVRMARANNEDAGCRKTGVAEGGVSPRDGGKL